MKTVCPKHYYAHEVSEDCMYCDPGETLNAAWLGCLKDAYSLIVNSNYDNHSVDVMRNLNGFIAGWNTVDQQDSEALRILAQRADYVLTAIYYSNGEMNEWDREALKVIDRIVDCEQRHNRTYQ